MILIEPLAGLANRMRALDSAIALSKFLGQSLFVEWQSNKDLNCKFSDIFKPIIHFKLNESKIRSFQKGKLFKIYYGLIRAKKFDISFNSVTSKRIDNKEMLEKLGNVKSIYIATYFRFFESEVPFSDFVPIDRLQETIDNVTKHYTPATIGVHIRRGDHKTAIEESPIGLFIDRINAEIKRNDKSHFFLSTDSAKVEQELKAKYGDKVITYQDKSLDRNSTKGVQDALVDLYSLSKTKKIFGSFHSSFSETAAQIGKIKLEIISN